MSCGSWERSSEALVSSGGRACSSTSRSARRSSGCCRAPSLGARPGRETCAPPHPFAIRGRRDKIRRGHSMTEVVVEYLGALQAEQGASRNTLPAYRSDLLDFTEFLRRHRDALASLAPDDLVAYLAGLRKRGLRPSSVARRMAAVRGLYRHLLREGALDRDPTEHRSEERRVGKECRSRWSPY